MQEPDLPKAAARQDEHGCPTLRWSRLLRRPTDASVDTEHELRGEDFPGAVSARRAHHAADEHIASPVASSRLARSTAALASAEPRTVSGIFRNSHGWSAHSPASSTFLDRIWISAHSITCGLIGGRPGHGATDWRDRQAIRTLRRPATEKGDEPASAAEAASSEASRTLEPYVGRAYWDAGAVRDDILVYLAQASDRS